MKNNIKELRLKNNWTQQELADFVGVTRQTINALEHERYNPSLKLSIDLTKVFKKYKIEDIFIINFKNKKKK
jgi:putative transcriptional regulator